MIALLLSCLLFSFIFAGVEAGLLSLNRIRLRHRAKLGERPARRLVRMLKVPERLLLTVVIITNLLNIFAITVATHLMVDAWGWIGYGAALLIFLPVVLFAVDLFPQALFRRLPYRVLSRLAAPVRMAMIALNPVLTLAIRLAQRMVPDGEARSGKLFGGREDFRHFTIESEKSGAISPTERQMIQNVVDFRALKARDLMQPLEKLPKVPLDGGLEAIISASRGGRFDQFLVTDAAGKIVGLVDLVEALLDRSPQPGVRSTFRRLSPVSTEQSPTFLLRRLRTTRTPILLVEEEGEPVGLIFRDQLYEKMVTPF